MRRIGQLISRVGHARNERNVKKLTLVNILATGSSVRYVSVCQSADLSECDCFYTNLMTLTRTQGLLNTRSIAFKDLLRMLWEAKVMLLCS